MNNIKNADMKFQICCGTFVCCHFVYQYLQHGTWGREEGAKGTKSTNPSALITFIAPRLWFHI
jgi:hypothetical protein